MNNSMSGLYDQMVSLVGTPPNDITKYFIYVACVYIVILSIRLLYKFICNFILNIKI